MQRFQSIIVLAVSPNTPSFPSGPTKYWHHACTLYTCSTYYTWCKHRPTCQSCPLRFSSDQHIIYGHLWEMIPDLWPLVVGCKSKFWNFITDEEINGNKCHKGPETTLCTMQCSAVSVSFKLTLVMSELNSLIFLDYFFDPSDLPLNSNRKKSSQWVHLCPQSSINEGVPLLSSAEVAIIWVRLTIIRLVGEIWPFCNQYVGESVKVIHVRLV